MTIAYVGSILVCAKFILQEIGRAARWLADFRSTYAPESTMATVAMEHGGKEGKGKGARKIWSKSRSGAPN